jgi:uncharacterized phage protein gp47/JayE
MAGLTDAGFQVKVLTDILTDKRAVAVTLFQDQTVPGDIVDTSDSALLGRLISLDSPSEADLWQAAQQVYSAFDPNSATGIALDNLVAYAGLTRLGQTYTTSSVLMAGDTNTLITSGSVVSSSTTGAQFNVNTPIALSPMSASGVTLSVLTTTNLTAYSITYTNTTTSNTITYTTDSTATLAEILNGLQAVIVSANPSLVSSVVGNTLVIDSVDVFQPYSFTTSTNLGIIKVRATGQVVANVAGVQAQPINSIDTILTPMLGWDSVINPVVAVSGSNLETDEALRFRFRNGKFDKATNSFDSVYSAIVNLANVASLIIYENDTSVTDANGIPPKSFLPIVVGGLSTDIANAIWENRPTGILSYGNTSVTINDVQGMPHVVSFSRPTPVVTYITLNITTDSTFPANGRAAIATSLLNYFSSNLGVGDDIIYSRLYTPINAVAGFQVNSMFIGTTASPTGTSNIVINFDQIASLNSVNIIIP